MTSCPSVLRRREMYACKLPAALEGGRPDQTSSISRSIGTGPSATINLAIKVIGNEPPIGTNELFRKMSKAPRRCISMLSVPMFLGGLVKGKVQHLACGVDRRIAP